MYLEMSMDFYMLYNILPTNLVGTVDSQQFSFCYPIKYWLRKGKPGNTSKLNINL